MRTFQSWTTQEDKLLKELINSNQSHNCWTQIAQKMNSIYPQRTRYGKQCRDRFINYLQIKESCQNTNQWTRSQTVYLMSMYKQMGSKWTLISKQLPGKAENCVKNKFYGSLRKTVRSLNMQLRSVTKKSKKQLRFKSIMRIFQYAEGRYRIQEELFSQSIKLREKLLNFTNDEEIVITDRELLSLVTEINEFSIAIRSYKIIRQQKKKLIHIGIEVGLSQTHTNKSQIHQISQKTSQSSRSLKNQMQLSGSQCKQNDNKQIQILSGESKKQYQEILNQINADLNIFESEEQEKQIQQWEKIFLDNIFGVPQSPPPIDHIF